MTPSGTHQPIRTILADDHALVRAGIRSLLELVDGVEVIAEARDGRELVSLVESLAPDLVLTDISMPGMDGLQAIELLHQSAPQVRILVLSMIDTVDSVKRAVAVGACGYIMKDAPALELAHAVQTVMSRGTYFSPSVARMLLMPSAPEPSDLLTHRQIEILTLLAHGHSSKQIAYDLGLSSKTVDVHRARIMERLELKDLASLTLYAVRHGLVKA